MRLRGKPKRPFLAVVICTSGRRETVGRAIRSVLDQDYPEFEVVVLDQSRDSETERVVATAAGADPRLRYMRLEVRGLSRAYNRGVAESEAELIAFTDDDCVAPPGWLTAIVTAFTEHPDASLIYGQVLGPLEGDTVRESEGVIPTLPIERLQRLNRQEGFRVFGMGANFATRRSLCRRLGGFDEILGGGGPLQSAQDFDYAYRVYLDGGTVLLDPRVVVHHYGFRSNGEWPATARSYGLGVGGFYWKHVRCGDVYALSLLSRQMMRVAARVVKSRMLCRPTEAPMAFLRSVAIGMWTSRAYEIDRHRRLYRLEHS